MAYLLVLSLTYTKQHCVLVQEVCCHERELTAGLAMLECFATLWHHFLWAVSEFVIKGHWAIIFHYLLPSMTLIHTRDSFATLM